MRHPHFHRKPHPPLSRMQTKQSISSFVYCFGSGEFNQIAQQNDVSSPSMVFKDVNVDRVFAGSWHSAMLSVDGELTTWGKMISLRTGDHSQGIFDDAKDDGKLSSIGPSYTQGPTKQQTGVKMAALNDNSTIVIDQNNFVHFMSYDNQHVTLPDATDVFAHLNTVIVFKTEKILVYTPLENVRKEFQLPDNELPKEAAITFDSFAILSDKNVLRIYAPNSEPVVFNDVVAVAASNRKYIILNPIGRIYEAFNNGGKRQISGICGNPISIFAGGAHYGCITFEGDCWTWGSGIHGQLGNSSFTNSPQPKKVMMKEDVRVISAAAGEEHTILLAVREPSYIPQVPESMKNTEYIKMLRMNASIQGAFLASEFDSKF